MPCCAGWIISYDVHRRDRLAAAAMRDSEVWRRELLKLLEVEEAAAKQREQEQAAAEQMEVDGEDSSDAVDDD